MQTIILGSSSKHRKQVLKGAGYEFKVRTRAINEKAIRSNDYAKLPLLIAEAKMKALLPHVKEEAIVITADQVVIWNGELREKPKDLEEAREFLKGYNKLPPQTYSAVVVHNTVTGRQAADIDVARIHFHQLPERIIAHYITEGNPLSAAGGFEHEHPLLIDHVKKIEGASDSVKGLPLDLLERLISEVKS